MGRWVNLTPDAVFESVLAIEPAWLTSRGIRGLAVDLDNTLVPYGQPVPDPDIVEHIRNLTAAGLRIIIVSNARPHRASLAAKELGIAYLANAGKPAVRAFRRALDLLGCEPGETAVIGDQVFRDILGARRAGCLALLVNPMSSRDFPGTKLLRWPERLIVRHLQARGDWPIRNTP